MKRFKVQMFRCSLVQIWCILQIVPFVGLVTLIIILIMPNYPKESSSIKSKTEDIIEIDVINISKELEYDLLESWFDGGVQEKVFNEAILLNIPKARFVYDARKILKIYHFIWVGNEWENTKGNYDVCLATQTSLERIYWISEVLRNWKGPYSLSLLIVSVEEWLILNLFLGYLQTCFHSSFLSNVALHVAIPDSVGDFEKEDFAQIRILQNLTMETIKQKQDLCSGTKIYLEFLIKAFPMTSSENLALKEVYPQNHMRNIARKACGIEWTLSLDVDVIPSIGIAEDIQQFYLEVNSGSHSCKKCAFIIPIFELEENQTFPATKADIVALFNSGKARQFHQQIWDGGHSATNHKLWTTTNIDGDLVKVSHRISVNKEQLYEPFYISPDNIPPFDERFMGYGYTRNTQFLEAYYTGWNFTVISPVFLIHWGFQTRKNRMSPRRRGIRKDIREEQLKRNEKLFKNLFKNEIKLKRNFYEEVDSSARDLGEVTWSFLFWTQTIYIVLVLLS